MPHAACVQRPLWPRLFAGLLALLCAALPQRGVQAQGARNFATLALVAEPQTLDPMASSADLVATIMQHVYETLYTFDAKWNVVPMLAEGMPKVSADGKTYAITLRRGVMLHNGRELSADDVVASLQRWMEQSPRGKAMGRVVGSLRAQGALGIEVVLREAYAPLLAQLALPSGMAAIMARDAIASPLKDFVGTGPYRFKERRPDQFVLLTRFERYSARQEPASGYGGRRAAAIEELRFVPVPNAATRVEGALAGQYDYADLLPVEALPRLEKSGGKTLAIMTPAFGFAYLVLNTREGVAASQPLRQAIQTALGAGEMLAAGFGDTRFFVAEANHFPKGSPFYSTAGADQYNQRNAARARDAAAQAGYQGAPVRVLTSRQYDFHYNMAQLMAGQLRRAGFRVELDVVDWATLVQRRNDPKLWDIYVTHSGQLPDPMLSPPQLGDGAPGWWDTPAKRAALRAFNVEIDPTKRAALWGTVQQLIYDEVPYVNVGKFHGLSAKSPALENYQSAIWPFFWNAKIAPQTR
ncbi:ABC transporter substrate-binding protein [Verminephrobacter aporrectodeae]|uniref:ABC transporter substrate-binding protein n=1 Tax=Verminephrobacter aporrectodeae subsp. tuberculatae TaxID=1110392 RepID=A0ABT3KN17_9BURK|nr:ABC transporter substrate-binding protein [Verminephrobacter aporrectodeae]MCW5254872.1 ABC transporter substrate-binding protein [Verminephrobacter aporrectodeae subsp. tuberculatae]MCW5319713.1 ABC transporter substrate-binding protein [Verminephrobacter aporrectodeae subsp. tuberculatae]MCW8164962.1 ABC transporter substrate-binding protein [Verminephrobacter aporrectodeae subsp. tuberculatae]MCW8167910.1 ABC transporter substrate-binding protein [Verminephrobacter aporrectodeae subsp. tu